MSRPILLTGAAGNLGTHLLRHAPPDIALHALWHRRQPDWSPAHQLDLADAEATERLIAELEPALVIHTAYGTRDLQRDIVQATAAVVRACARHHIELLHMSTDALFDGTGAPYPESAPPSPAFPYGEAKAIAEHAVEAALPDAAVVRASLIVGEDPLNSSSAWIVDKLRAGERVSLFVDEVRTPILADDLARQLWEIALLPVERRRGRWHLAGPESLSRYALGLLLARRFGLDADLLDPAWSIDATPPRPRDLRLLTPRADRELRHRARPISTLLAPR